MIEFLEKHWILIAGALVSIFLITFLFLPVFAPLMTMAMVLVSISVAATFIIQKHLRFYQKAECTREKMMRNLAFDITSLLLTMGAAMYVGGLAGGYFGLRAGFWFGLIAGFLGGFVAAWMVRVVLGRLVVTA